MLYDEISKEFNLIDFILIEYSLLDRSLMNFGLHSFRGVLLLKTQKRRSSAKMKHICKLLSWELFYAMFFKTFKLGRESVRCIPKSFDNLGNLHQKHSIELHIEVSLP